MRGHRYPKIIGTRRPDLQPLPLSGPKRGPGGIQLLVLTLNLNRWVAIVTLYRRWTRFLVGMVGLSLSISLMIRSGLGLGPWDAFHLGLQNVTGITVGTASIVAGFVIIVGLAVMGERPRAATIVNMFAVGLFLDLLLPHVPPARGFPAALAFALASIALAGLSTGLYVSARLGNGARDGLAMTLSERSGHPVRRMRTAVELVVLALGWMMGGTVGLGTVLFSLLIGPSMERGLRLFGALPPPPPSARAGREPAVQQRRAA